MIDVRHLTRYYGPIPALNDVSFQAYRGEIVGFLGPNGAGKTTAMRILTGYMPPSSGQALVAGHDVVEDSLAARRATGYLPENTPLYMDMTVIGYLDFMARLRGVRNRSQEVERVMARVAIDDRADDLIGQLSKGLRQRVGIAQALVHDPEVIVLDEPTIGLDPRQIREVRGLIRELGGDHTVLLSTHILEEAEKVCDRILIIKQGRIAAVDAVEQLARRARHGSEEFHVSVLPGVGDSEVARFIASVDGVTSVDALGDGRFHVVADRERESRARIAQGVHERGWRLFELAPIELTLEDIYLQVTSEQDVLEVDGEAAEGEDEDEAMDEGADESVDEADAQAEEGADGEEDEDG
jgi:ABC-2 type transport system ATP-binding protein